MTVIKILVKAFTQIQSHVSNVKDIESVCRKEPNSSTSKVCFELLIIILYYGAKIRNGLQFAKRNKLMEINQI